MSRRFGLKEETIAQINAVFARHAEVKQAIIYGSRARGDYRNGSDVDIVLVGGSDLDDKALFSIITELENLPLPHTFDILVYPASGSAELRVEIDRDGVLFYERVEGSDVS
ncbi:MAG: nucleotidyltransferase domain-containing protein [Synergistaceae bacterium]|nr:nucleotidyltransferase domain-containing protein [Synergistaceae bacterium]